MLQRVGKIQAVYRALVHDHLEIQILPFHRLPLPVQLDHPALGSQSQKHRQVSEIVDVVIDRMYAETAEVRDNHAAVKGTHIDQRLGQQAEIVQHIQNPDEEFQHQARKAEQDLRRPVGPVRARAGADLVHLLPQLAEYVIHRVRRVKDRLDAGLVGIRRHAPPDHHHSLDVVAGVYLLAADKAVQTGAAGDGPDIRGQNHMEHAHPLPALFPVLPEPLLQRADLHAVGKIVHRVAALCHQVGHDFVKWRERAEQAAVPPVPETASVVDIRHSSLSSGSKTSLRRRGAAKKSHGSARRLLYHTIEPRGMARAFSEYKKYKASLSGNRKHRTGTPKNLTSRAGRFCPVQTIPWASIASATLRKPATFAPTTRLPSAPTSREAS